MSLYVHINEMAYQGRGKGGGGVITVSFHSSFLNIHRREWSQHCVVDMAGATRKAAVISLHVQYTPYNRAPIYSIIVSWFGPAVRR